MYCDKGDNSATTALTTMPDTNPWAQLILPPRSLFRFSNKANTKTAMAITAKKLVYMGCLSMCTSCQPKVFSQ